MGAEIVQNNQLLHQLAQQFPMTRTSCCVSTFDFQAAWNQARFLAFQKSIPSSSDELMLSKSPLLYCQICTSILLPSPSCGRAYIRQYCSSQSSEYF